MDKENASNNYYGNLVSNLKLTMFNIIADQESKLAGLVDYLNQHPEGVNVEQLVDMYNKQRGIVSSLTIMTNDLSSTLTQLDSNEQVINEILSKRTAATMQNVVQNTPVNNVEVQGSVNQEQENNMETTNSVSVVENSEVEDSASPLEEVSTVEESKASEVETVSVENETINNAVAENASETKNSLPIEEVPAKSETTDVVVATSDEATSVEDVPAQAETSEVKEEAPADAIVATSDDAVPIEEAPAQAETSEVKEETPTDAIVATSDEATPVEEAPAQAETSEVKEEAPTDVIVATSDEVAPIEEAPAKPETTDVVVDTSDEAAPVEEAPAQAETSEVKEEAPTDVIAVTSDEATPIEDVPEKPETTDVKEEALKDVVAPTGNEVIPIEVPSVTEPVVDVKDINPIIAEKPTDNVIQIKSDSLDLDDDDDEVVNTPIASLSDEQVDSSSETMINFIADDANFSRAILINKKQAGNLRKSLMGQTELFNSFTVKNKDDVVITENNIEEMLEKATSLYGEGKVDESEKLMKKIDEFREKSQSVNFR